MHASLIFAPYALPAAMSLMAKGAIYFYARYSKVHNLRTKLYLLFLFSLSIQNLAELTFFLAKAEGLPEPWGGKLYFGASIFAVAFLLHLALVVATKWSRGEPPVSGLVALYGPALILQALLWTTPYFVVGFQAMGYTYTKIPGPLFFLWEAYVVGYFCAATVLLVHGVRTQLTPYWRLQNKLLLLGVFPFVALAVVIIILQRFGFRGFNSTATLPLATTFLLAVTAYAIHQHRLFDIEFFIPWSKVRKRKTMFYQRIQSAIAEVASLSSVPDVMERVANTLRCQVGLIGAGRPVLALVDGQQVKPELQISSFPRETLQKVEQIVVANEIADSRPDLYALMKEYRVDAIVPFATHSGTCGNWMLLGEHFSDNVYSPLDFKVIEGLFARIAELFVDDLLLVRTHLADAREEIKSYRDRLVNAWSQLEEERQRTSVLEQRVRRLREEAARLQRQRLRVVAGDAVDDADLPPEVASGRMTMRAYLEQCEVRMIRAALKVVHGDPVKAARLLGVSDLRMHRYLTTAHGSSGEADVEFES